MTGPDGSRQLWHVCQNSAEGEMTPSGHAAESEPDENVGTP